MMNLIRLTTSLAAIAAAVLIAAPPLAAQTKDGVMGDLMKDAAGVEKKVLALANAMPESVYAWRPSRGVRSAGEVLQHVAADNYLLPALVGIQPPPETGITKEYKTAAAFEKRPMDKAAIIAEVGKSFAFLRESMSATTEAQLTTAIDLFGQKSTTRALWITTVTHLHEHLGQLIAYARSNNLAPPWSK